MSDAPNRTTPKNGPESTFAYIEVNGAIFDDWTDYHVTQDLLEPTSKFVFHVPLMSGNWTASFYQRTGLRKGARVRIFVKTPQSRIPTLVLVGIIDEFLFEEERGGKGATLQVSGRCHMMLIVDGDLIERFDLTSVTFKDLIYRVLVTPPKGRSRGYFNAADILISNDANRQIMTGKVTGGAKISKDAPPELEHLKVDQAEPHPGETVYQFLHRHAQRFGLMIWGTADGKIVFGRPRYDQPSLYKLSMRALERGVDNNVKKFTRQDSMKHRASEIHVFGHSHRSSSFGSPVHVAIYDQEVEDCGFFKPVVVHDNNARDNEQATQRAKNEQSKRNQTGDVLHAIVEGYDADGAVFAVDTMADVAWDKGDIHDARYVIRRAFTCSRHSGVETLLDLVPKNSIALGDVQYITKLPKATQAVVDKNIKSVPQIHSIERVEAQITIWWPGGGGTITGTK